jgi:ribosomal protein S18 acetylase RimI-like enzyme
MNFYQITKEELKKNIDNYLRLINDWKYCDWNEENFIYELPLKWDFSFSVYSNKVLVGFCFASNKIPDGYYIHLLFISPDLRGNLLGFKILKHAQEIALKHNIHKLELRCPESNIQALNFYLKNGFKVKEKIKDETSREEVDYYLINTF